MLKLEVGKTYVTADGTPVKIVGKDDSVWPFNGSDGDCYLENGRLLHGQPDEGDLIAELQEPEAVLVGPEAAKPAAAEPLHSADGFFLDQLMFELIRVHTDASAGWIAERFSILADARATR